MLSLEHTPMPMLPSFDEPMAPKRTRRSSPTLSRRVRANLNVLSIPDIHSNDGPLKLLPQGRSNVGGLSFDKILMNGAMRNKQVLSTKKSHVIVPLSSKTNSPSRTPVVLKSSPLKGPNNSLLSLRMAALVKSSTDTKAHLKFGGGGKFELPGRSSSSPYRPLVSRTPPLRTRSFGALCA